MTWNPEGFAVGSPEYAAMRVRMAAKAAGFDDFTPQLRGGEAVTLTCTPEEADAIADGLYLLASLKAQAQI